MICNWHLCDNELTGKQTKFCSIKCKSKLHVANHRKRTKIKAVAYKGGECEICGYSKCIDAFDFHHIEPEHKDFGIAQYGHSRAWSRVQKELDKCVMVCCRCHREIHAGISFPP